MFNTGYTDTMNMAVFPDSEHTMLAYSSFSGTRSGIWLQLVRTSAATGEVELLTDRQLYASTGSLGAGILALDENTFVAFWWVSGVMSRAVGRFDAVTHVQSMGATYSDDSFARRFRVTSTKYAAVVRSGSTLSMILCEIDPDVLSETCESAIALTSSYSRRLCAAQLSERHIVLVYENTAGAGESVLATIACDGGVTVSAARSVDNFVVPGYSEQWASEMTCVGMSSTMLVYAFQDRYAVGQCAPLRCAERA